MAHSCGVFNPHELGRQHAYIVTDAGLPEPLIKHYPHVPTRAEFLTGTASSAAIT